MKNAAKSGSKKPASAQAKPAAGASAGRQTKSADGKSATTSKSKSAGEKSTTASNSESADDKSRPSASKSGSADEMSRPTASKCKVADEKSKRTGAKSKSADVKSKRPGSGSKLANDTDAVARGKSKPKAESEPKERIIPDKIVPTKLADYLEIMTIAVFQAGMSWAMVLNKLDDYRSAFSGYEPDAVSKFGDKQIAQIIESAKILRSEKKIKGTVENARMMLEMADKHGSFQSYLRSFDSFEQLSNDIRKRFKYMGELSVYYFLFRVGEPVPDFEKWIVTIDGEHPRMREMVEKDQRRQDRSGR